jgi:N-acetylglucosaminyldiphosphoundecaprenol N-acetyl-beta-D-mannosaminyltransferase
MPSVRIIGLPIYGGSLSLAVNDIIKQNAEVEKRNLLISATGAHGLVYAKRTKTFRDILASFYLNLPDGVPSVWIGRLKGASLMERCYGPDFFREMIVSTKDKPINHYFCGGKEKVAEELKKICVRKFGNGHVVGTYSPPFREMSDEELNALAQDINSKHTDIVWIGLSTPKQEIFAHRLSKFTEVHFLCTVGAAFDFYTGNVKQAPKFIQRSGLEWLFRLLIEPKRLWKRYFEIVPKFLFYSITELVAERFHKNAIGEK